MTFTLGTMADVTGWTFNGWTVTNGGTVYTGSATLTPAAGTTSYTFTGKWTAHTFTITYKFGSATLGTQECTYDTSTLWTLNDIPSASRPGNNFTLAGWATAVNTTSTTYAGGASANTAYTSNNLTLYAVFSRAPKFHYYSDATTYVNGTNALSKTQYLYRNNNTTNLYTLSLPANTAIAYPNSSTLGNWATKVGWRDDTTAGNKEFDFGGTYTGSSQDIYAVYSR